MVAELAERSVRAGLLESWFDHQVPAGADFHLVYPPALGEDRRLARLVARTMSAGERWPEFRRKEISRTMRLLYTLAYPVLSDHDGHWIEAFRHEYDPQFAVVGAHFTMAFGCTDVREDVYMSHVEAASNLARPVRFTCRYAMLGTDHQTDSAHVFLVPDEGYSDLSRLHDHLYRGVLAEHLRLDVPFIPHITMGACSDRWLAKRLCDDLNDHGLEVGGLVDTLTVAAVDGGKVRELGAFGLAVG